MEPTPERPYSAEVGCATGLALDRFGNAIPAVQVERQIARTRAYKEQHAGPELDAALERIRNAATSSDGDNLLPLMRDALRANATLGQICNTLREVWGEYRPGY